MWRKNKRRDGDKARSLHKPDAIGVDLSGGACAGGAAQRAGRPTLTVIGCVQADVVMSPVTDLPSPGGTLLTDQMTVRVGGAGANAALASVEAGMDVRLIGCIGDDQLGGWMREQLAPAGLADELVVVAGETSGLTVALESPARDRTFLTYLGVNARWEPSMIPDDALTATTCCCATTSSRRDSEATRRGGCSTPPAPVALAHSSTPPGTPTAFAAQTRAEVRELLPSVDVFLPNEVEACALAERPGDAARGGACPAGGLGWLGGRQARTDRMLRGRAGRDRDRRPGAGRDRRRHHRSRRRLQRRPRSRARSRGAAGARR